MSGIETAIAWALIHSVWEVCLIALLLRLALPALSPSQGRYAAACSALLMCVSSFVLTFVLFLPPGHAAGMPVMRIEPLRGLAPAGDVPIPFTSSGLKSALPWISVFWLAGVFVFNLRNFASYIAVWRLRHRGTCAAPESWQNRLRTLCDRSGIRRTVTIVESCMANIPAVVGHFRPVILVPVGFLAGMPVEQIESLLIHELAHIRRYDYVLNIIQSFFETVLFYHPAMWWISKTVRIEREHCCDDLVVAAVGDAYTYAAALSTLEEQRSRTGELAMSAAGGTLMNRIRRLLDAPVDRKQTAAGAPALVIVALLLVVIGTSVVVAWPIHSGRVVEKAAAPAVEPSVQPSIQPSTRPMSAPEPRQQRSAVPAAGASRALQNWIEQDVVYIITPEERNTFLALRSDEERQRFIEQFWERRDPTPGTVDNEYKNEHYQRIGFANGRFGTSAVRGWQTDRGRTYILYGPPDELESHPSGGTYERPIGQGGGTIRTAPFETWRYRYIEGMGSNIIFEFVDSTGTGEFRQVAAIDSSSPQQSAAIDTLQQKIEQLLQRH